MSKKIEVIITELETFIVGILTGHGLSEADSRITAINLISADRRGIESHGVARLNNYVEGIRSGVINLSPEIRTVRETPVSFVIDGNGGMGQPIAHHTMKKCIEKAQTAMMCFASVRNSNHYGIAGFYTQMALDANMIGISMTNSAPLVVPTFAKDAVIGTNPISVGIPAGKNFSFLLDMATSTVPRGKLEVYALREEPIPDSWATDEKGIPAVDASRVLNNLAGRHGGGLLPLGGGTELTGGHKGYGLGALVDIFSGVFSSGAFGKDVCEKKDAPSGISHFLGAINPEAFTGTNEIKENMDRYIDMLKTPAKAEGRDKIFVAGEKEYLKEINTSKTVGIQEKIFNRLNELGSEFGLELGGKNNDKM